MLVVLQNVLVVSFFVLMLLELQDCFFVLLLLELELELGCYFLDGVS